MFIITNIYVIWYINQYIYYHTPKAFCVHEFLLITSFFLCYWIFLFLLILRSQEHLSILRTFKIQPSFLFFHFKIQTLNWRWLKKQQAIAYSKWSVLWYPIKTTTVTWIVLLKDSVLCKVYLSIFSREWKKGVLFGLVKRKSD